MKSNLLSAALALAAAACLTPPPAALAGMPQPMCVYYGQAKDGFGLPYMQDADVILRRGTNEIARQTIKGTLSPGVNFALYVHLDAGGAPTSYSSRALHTGDLISIYVRDANGEIVVMENKAVPAIGQPGDLILQNVTASPDVNNDGIPDIWEYELIAWSGGLLRTLNDVKPGDDFDGDGVSNLDEYLAGTFPFLKDDYFRVEQMALTPNGRLSLTFLSVPGKIYNVTSSTNMTQAVWTPCPFGVSDTASLQTTPAEGNGDWLSLYVPVGAPSRFFRVSVR